MVAQLKLKWIPACNDFIYESMKSLIFIEQFRGIFLGLQVDCKPSQFSRWKNSREFTRIWKISPARQLKHDQQLLTTQHCVIAVIKSSPSRLQCYRIAIEKFLEILGFKQSSAFYALQRLP